jgi:hypothetical protein
MVPRPAPIQSSLPGLMAMLGMGGAGPYRR